MEITPREFDREALKAELSFEFTRSGGPGGQGVNTSDTKAQLRWNVGASRLFSPEEKARIKADLSGMINKRGEVVMVCQVTRSQRQNREMVLEKFLADLEDALRPIVPRILTRKPAAVRRRELEGKKRRGALKRQRGERFFEE
jgi:ribosome-associated protein